MNSMQELKDSLTELGQGLFLPDDCDEWARQKIDSEIFQRLRNFGSMTYSINRTKILGSAAKRTGLWITMDYDCVVFVNNNPPQNPHELKPLWDQILWDWERALTDVRAKQCTHRGMKIKLEGISVDLLIAFDATGGSSISGSYGHPYNQYTNTLRVVDDLPARFDKARFSRDLSTSLSELAVFFMQSTNPVTHELARIAKLWVYFAYPSQDYYVSGQSTVVELIVAKAVETSEYSNNILFCLVRFLELMINYKNLSIDLQSRDDLKERFGGLKCEGAIMDPSNPYNNLYDGANVEKFLEVYCHRARETLAKISNQLNSYRTEVDAPWFVWLKILSVDGSAERHGIPQKVGRPTLYISLSHNKVHLPEKIRSPGSDEKRMEDLMNFICFNAAFIPRNVSSFQEYFLNLQKCLQWTANMSLEMDYANHHSVSNFLIGYPVAYHWAKGIQIAAHF